MQIKVIDSLYMHPIIIEGIWIALALFLIVLAAYAGWVVNKTVAKQFMRSARIAGVALALNLVNLALCLWTVVQADAQRQAYDLAARANPQVLGLYQNYNPWGYLLVWVVVGLIVLAIRQLVRSVQLTYPEGEFASTMFPNEGDSTNFQPTRL